MASSARKFSLLFFILAAGCESASNDGAPLADPADVPQQKPDDGNSITLQTPQQDAGPTARDLELARMQAHLDSLYSQSDVVHRFTTAYGDGVDCVPFEKQPGFAGVGSLDGASPGLDSMGFGGVQRLTSMAGFGDGNDDSGAVRMCPDGAVPIRRYALADLARFATLEDFLRKQPLRFLDGSASSYVHEHAGYSVSTSNWGVSTTLNLWNPAVDDSNFSLSQLWVLGGSGKDFQSIEAGYTFDRIRDGVKDQSRLFIFSTQDNYGSTGCYDLTCKDFVQLANSHVLLGGRFDKASVVNGEQREFTLRAQFCPASQCKAWEGWWIRYEGGTIDEWIGFYPRKLYSAVGIANGATRVDVGGEVAYRSGKTHTATDMGSGLPPTGGFRSAAYHTGLRTITTKTEWSHFPSSMSTIDEKPACYTQAAMFDPDGPFFSSSTFYFGGTGASADCK